MTQNNRNPVASLADPGCTVEMGFREVLGFEVEEWAKDWAVLSLQLNQSHLNRNGFVHGGVIMSLMDSACGLCGVYCALPGHVRRCLTVSMNTQFISPARDGSLRVEARMVSRGRRMFFAEARVFTGDVLVATGSGTLRYVGEGGDERGTPLQLES
ncbi:PaaI family thioesterase [Marinobacter sp. SS21]|uniref:PaaI family thioesterase n=1 Tax=Marinobacter sp. SS21 TaxID=2979460 RepID=UPI00232B452E|nr:PaaI family thioesterase [Marinobacter sp. SS21]MDC0662972.1 PaaI family thioesterase [Marinobacter sp. SS21]